MMIDSMEAKRKHNTTDDDHCHMDHFIANDKHQATGPLTQATGPPRSDAGVGIGMLRGISLLSAN